MPRMISALILAFADDSSPVSPEGLVRSLASIVPVAIESVLRDVVLIAPAAPEDRHEDLRAICDHAGCDLLFAPAEGEALRMGLSALRQDLALILRAGFAPRPGFAVELADLARLAAAGQGRGAVLWAERPGLRRFLGLRPPVVALLGRRPALLAASAGSFNETARRLRPTTRFECGALRIG